MLAVAPPLTIRTDDRGVAKVQFFDDDRLLCEVTAAPFNCAYQPRGADVGRNTLIAVASDGAGQTTSVVRANNAATISASNPAVSNRGNSAALNPGNNAASNRAARVPNPSASKKDRPSVAVVPNSSRKATPACS